MSFEEIILKIQNKPVLWMSADPNYKNRLIKAKLWRELATKLGIEEDVLKKKWKHLQDQYRKELKKKPDSRSGAEANDWLSSWKYFQSMEFMRHEVMPVPFSGNLNPVEVEGNVDIPNEEDSTDVDIDMVDSVAPSPASQQSPAPSTSQPTPISRKKKKAT